MLLSLPRRWYNAHRFGACTPNESDPMLLLKEVFNIIITTETKPPYSALRIDAWLIVLNLCIKHETHMLGCGDGSPRRQRWMIRWGWGCMRGFLLMHWKKKKKTRIEVVSCAIFAYLQSQGFVFIQTVILLNWALTQTNTDEFVLWDMAWNHWQITLFGHNALVMCYTWVLDACISFCISWSERRTEKERG